MKQENPESKNRNVEVFWWTVLLIMPLHLIYENIDILIKEISCLFPKWYFIMVNLYNANVFAFGLIVLIHLLLYEIIVVATRKEIEYHYYKSTWYSIIFILYFLPKKAIIKFNNLLKKIPSII